VREMWEIASGAILRVSIALVLNLTITQYSI